MTFRRQPCLHVAWQPLETFLPVDLVELASSEDERHVPRCASKTLNFLVVLSLRCSAIALDPPLLSAVPWGVCPTCFAPLGIVE